MMTQPGPPPAGGPARLALQPSTSATKLNSAITLTIYAENVVNLSDVIAQLKYDPKMLRIVNIAGGELPGRSSAQLEPVKNVLDDIGRADMRLSRGSSIPPVSGSGALFVVAFQAIGRGNTSVALSSCEIRTPNGPASVTMPVPASVTVE